jgi:hypothetical protein
MKRAVLYVLFSSIVLCLGLVGCAGTTTATIGSVPPTLHPYVIYTPTPVYASLQIGTGLSGSGANVTVTNPTASFTPSDTFAFVVHLQAAAKSNKAEVVIEDPSYFTVYKEQLPIQASTKVIAASLGPLGSLLKEPDIAVAPPKLLAGDYALSVFLYPPPFMVDYANGYEFTYNP